MTEPLPPLAWHYTTSAGLISMLSEQRLWATSAAFLNDRDEIRMGYRRLEAALKKRGLTKSVKNGLTLNGVLRGADGTRDLYLLCASKAADELSLWRGYGATQPAEYAIGLDPQVALVPVLQNAAAEPRWAEPRWAHTRQERDEEGYMIADLDQTRVESSGWRDVVYLTPGSRHVEKEVDRLLSAFDGSDDGKWDFSAPLLPDWIMAREPVLTWKHPGFADEREKRLAWRVAPSWRFVRRRAGRYGITPYIELAATADGTEFTGALTERWVDPEHINRLPIRSVTLGPTVLAAAEEALRDLLHDTGYIDVEVTRSRIPFR